MVEVTNDSTLSVFTILERSKLSFVLELLTDCRILPVRMNCLFPKLLDLSSLWVGSNCYMTSRVPINPNEMLGRHLENILDGHGNIDKLIRNGILKMKFEAGYPD